ncbi:MAG: hypothetical protein ACFFD2_06980 [Promethearchaeota archaeon]
MDFEIFGTIGLIFGVIALMAVYYATIISLQNYRKDQARHSLFLFCFFLLIAIWGTLQDVILVTGYTAISSYTHFLFIGTIFVLILFIDTISRERLDLVKILIFTNLVTAGAIFLFYDEVVMVNLIFGTFMFFQAILWIYFTVKIYRKSPHSIKTDALILIIGGILFTLVPVIIEFLPDFGLNINIPFDTELSIGIGVLITAYIFKKQPKLAYILPFRASRLTIIDSTRGISIFDHFWVKSFSSIDNELFGGMIQGISGMLKETINRGNIRQIELEHATLLVYLDEKYPVAFVLLSNEFNKSLRLALKQFADRFYLEFSDKFENLSEVTQFEPASKLITEVFPFIPEYDEVI